MLNDNLAELYGIETKNLNKDVSQNARRLPEDFMFKLTPEEYDALKFQIGTSKTRGGRRYTPRAFTEQNDSAFVPSRGTLAGHSATNFGHF